MNHPKIHFIALCAILTIFGIVIVSTAGASEQGIVVITYSFDGKEIVSETEISFEEINSTMTSVGDPGGVELSFQGPTFKPDNLWDEDATLNVDNLKTRVIGVPVREILEYAGISENIENITFVADDGFSKKLPVENVFSVPDDQGEVILAYWNADEGLLPEESGYRIYFNAPDGLYSNTDMKNTLPEEYWHFFMNTADNTAYPSAKGLSVAKVVEIHVQLSE